MIERMHEFGVCLPVHMYWISGKFRTMTFIWRWKAGPILYGGN